MMAASMTSASSAQKEAKTKGSHTEAVTLYISFCALCSLVWQSFQGVGLSTLPTLSVGLQVLALVFLRAKIVRTVNVNGISAKTLQMKAFVHGLRLCSTTWLKGYIPSDETGDWFYQLMDVSALLLCLSLLYTVLKTHRHTYQEDADDFDVKPVVLSCVLLAVMVHPDLNDRVMFDSVWAASLYIDVASVIPQLWMMSKISSGVEALTGHYVAMMAFARVLEFVFWFFGFTELATPNGGNTAGWAIILAQSLQLVLLADFMYYYVKAWMTACCTNPKTLSCCNARIPLASDSAIEV